MTKIPSSSYSPFRKPFRHYQTSIKPWKPPFAPPPSPLPSRTVVLLSYIASIKNHTTHLNLSHAFLAYSSLRHQTPPSPISHHHFTSITSLLICSSTLKSLPQGQQLHAHILYLGFLPSNPPLSAKLISLYSTCGQFSVAHALAEESHDDHPLPWNVLISAYVRNGFWSEAVRVYRNMVRREVQCDAYTLPTVLKACGELGEEGLILGEEIHKEVTGRSDLDADLFVKNGLVSMYAKSGEMKLARKVFDGMSEKDEVSWNAIISGYASLEMWGEVIEVFDLMSGGNLLNLVVDRSKTVVLNTVAGGYLQLGKPKEGLKLVSKILHGRSNSSEVDHITFVIGLRSCAQIGDISLGSAIHGMIVRESCGNIETVKNGLITMYSKCKNTNRARQVFDICTDKTLVSWNCMITGYCNSDQSEEASSTFRRLISSTLSPNHVTVLTILSLCGRIANLHHGKELHCYITRHRFDSDDDHNRLVLNSLVDMYSKSGRMKEAQKIFDKIVCRDEVSYTSLIAGYGMQGDGQTALLLFKQMKTEHRIKPDHVTMVALLSACCHAGLVCEGEKIFESMNELHGVSPVMEHYSCMVDLYSRAGLLNKAENFIYEMPMKATAAMWASLVGACGIYRNVEIGERACRKLLEMKSENSGHYVLVCNMLGSCGLWEEVCKVRLMMREMRIQKVPACAWLDVGNVLYPFLVDDFLCRETTYRVLDEMTEHIKDLDCVAGLHYQNID